MFPTSTQCKVWMFTSEEELNMLREKANLKHIKIYGKSVPETQQYEVFLTPEEEKLMVRRYEINLRDFCKRFQPLMPKCVVGTAFHYFKRFYLNNSVMNYHPKEIMVTCMYLACKVEEFNVSLAQFVANIKGDRDKATDIILNNELLLMEQLNFHLSVHNPFRPVEGLLIDIKTRCNLQQPERLRTGTEQFLEKALLTDVVLLYAPAQVALAAVLHAASKIHENLDAYVTDTLFAGSSLPPLIDAVRIDFKFVPADEMRLCVGIRSMVKVSDYVPDKNQQKLLDKKLEKCRNPENNPDSEIYKKRMQALLDDDDEIFSKLTASSEALDNSALTVQPI